MNKAAKRKISSRATVLAASQNGVSQLKRPLRQERHKGMLEIG
jgi:hypothetical protein